MCRGRTFIDGEPLPDGGLLPYDLHLIRQWLTDVTDASLWVQIGTYDGRTLLPAIRGALIEAEYEKPADALEQQVADIVASVMDVDMVGRGDSFYDLGGGSMQAIRICARVERETEYRAEPVWLLEHDELADFVAQLRQAHTGSGPQS